MFKKQYNSYITVYDRFPGQRGVYKIINQLRQRKSKKNKSGDIRILIENNQFFKYTYLNTNLDHIKMTKAN